ncbi:MAG: hypothetical protein ACI4JS_07790 [Oscillospiraceae bacterium]
MDISKYINDEKPLSDMSELLELPGTQVFFRTEQAVIDGLPLTRRSAERLMEYAFESRSIVAWKAIICKYWQFLTEEEKRLMIDKAYSTLDRDLVSEWLSSAT